MKPRSDIVGENNYTHAFFRCHNQQFFLKDKRIKLFLLKLWAKYKKKYSIQIFDFNIMDNHAHMLLKVPDAENLGNFMRTVNSQLSRYINKLLDRDSQAIKERYKSPVIADSNYLVSTMQYIWLNRYKVSKIRPEEDIYCSASWRLNPQLINSLFPEVEPSVLEELKSLLDPYEDLPVNFGKSEFQFIKDMINQAISKVENYTKEIFENYHTIADPQIVELRAQLLYGLRKECIP